jgi:hypothetical protein
MYQPARRSKIGFIAIRSSLAAQCPKSQTSAHAAEHAESEKETC